jgi:hypothetical protein
MGAKGPKGPDKTYQRAQQRELDRVTDEENRRKLALARGRMGKASLLSGLGMPDQMVALGSAMGSGIGRSGGARGRSGSAGVRPAGGMAPPGSGGSSVS